MAWMGPMIQQWDAPREFDLCTDGEQRGCRQALGSPLVLAAAKGHTKILKRLLAAGALVNQPCGESAKACGGLEGAPTALHAGSQLLHPGVVEALLRAGADPTLTDIYGADAKKMAAEAAQRVRQPREKYDMSLLSLGS